MPLKPNETSETSEVPIARFAFVVIPRFNMMTLTTLIETLRVANYLSPRPRYEWQYITFDEPDVIASNGLSIEAKTLEQAGQEFDMVFVLGSWGCEHTDNPELFNWLRWLNMRGITICGVELGVYLLAKAKLLSKKLATTHWSCLAGFAELYPRVNLSEQIYTIDRNIITCSGGTAGIDLMLYLIGIRHGDYLKSEIADQILHYPIRDAQARQRHTLGSSAERVHPVIYKAIELIEKNIAEPITVPQIAQQIGLSQRQLERYFKRDMGCSLIQFSQLLRLQYARVLLTSTEISVREASVASGFNSMSHFSYAFMKCFGKTPSQYRYAWPESDNAPSWPGTVFSLIESTREKALVQVNPAEHG